MKTIRTNCFETNSSSTHSITIDSTMISAKRWVGSDIAGRKIYPGEFGWEWKKFSSFEKKASYFWTLVAEYSCEDGPRKQLRDRLGRLAEKYNFELMSSDRDTYAYVDHGLEHYEKFLRMHPELNTDAGLYEFLTSKSAWIMLGNDNEMGPPDFLLTDNQIRSAPSYLTLDVDSTFRYAMHGDRTEENVAEEAAYAWREKNDKRHDSGWMKILSISNREIKCAVEKYDYKTQVSSIVEEFTLTYTIEHNAKYIAPSL